MKIWITSLFAFMISISAIAGSSPPGDDILGVWKTFDKHGQWESSVEIYKINDKYCAKIISLAESNWPASDKLGMAGKPKNDRSNPDAALRNRPIIGLQFMHDFIYNNDNNQWDDGRIYDPENGKTYKCKITLISTNRLKVRGYIGISLLGRTEVWTR